VKTGISLPFSFVEETQVADEARHGFLMKSGQLLPT
jgi:hypothetical protein